MYRALTPPDHLFLYWWKQLHDFVFLFLDISSAWVSYNYVILLPITERFILIVHIIYDYEFVWIQFNTECNKYSQKSLKNTPTSQHLRQEETTSLSSRWQQKVAQSNHLLFSSYLFEEHHRVVFHLILLENLRKLRKCKLCVGQIKGNFLEHLRCLAFQTLQKGIRAMQFCYFKCSPSFK